MSNISSAVLNTSNNSVWFAGKRHFYTCFESAQVAQRKFNTSIGFTPVEPKPIATSTTRDEDALAFAAKMDERTDEWYEKEMDYLCYNKANNLDKFGNAKEGECNAPDGDDNYSDVDNEPTDEECMRMDIAQSGLSILDSLEVMQNTSRRTAKDYKAAVKNIEDIARQMDSLRNS
jgi:hypothetical protein